MSTSAQTNQSRTLSHDYVAHPTRTGSLAKSNRSASDSCLQLFSSNKVTRNLS